MYKAQAAGPGKPNIEKAKGKEEALVAENGYTRREK